MSDDLVERVAEAIFEAPGWDWMRAGPSEQDEERTAARAAIRVVVEEATKAIMEKVKVAESNAEHSCAEFIRTEYEIIAYESRDCIAIVRALLPEEKTDE